MRSPLIILCAVAALPAATPPPPDLLERARSGAVNYSRTLPDFVCTQVVHRYVSTSTRWRLLDTLVLKLDFAGGHESYALVSVDGKPASEDYQALGGATSTGEFGTLLRRVFGIESKAVFTWERRARHGGRNVEIYRYAVPLAHATHELAYRSGDADPVVIRVADHGEVYVDENAANILRIDSEVDDIPRRFPIRYSHTTLEYGEASIGGRPYLLPIRAQVELRTTRGRTRNDVEFIQYRKFGADATVSFGEVKEK
jgi:hypothetical protein